MDVSSSLGDSSSLRSCNDGTKILTIYTEENDSMTYVITGDRILFTMHRTAIVYEKRDTRWEMKDIHCDDAPNPLMGIMTLMGTMNMITLYKIDLSWRWFQKTVSKAIDVAKTVNVCDVPLTSSPLLRVDMGSYDDRSKKVEELDVLYEEDDDGVFYMDDVIPQSSDTFEERFNDTRPRTSPLPIANRAF